MVQSSVPLKAVYRESGPVLQKIGSTDFEAIIFVQELLTILWKFVELPMLLFPNALCCSLYERNCVCAVTDFFTKFLPANNFCQLLRVTRKRSWTSAGNAQAQLHFQDDQQRAFGISNISNWPKLKNLSGNTGAK